MNDPITFFQNRIKTLLSNADTAKSKVTVLVWVRGLCFLGFVILSVWLANAREMQLLLFLVAVFIPLFGVVVTYHNRAKFSLKQIDNLILINENEIERLNGDLSKGPTGEEFKNDQHAYAPDLDVFGQNSIFQLLIRSKSQGTIGVLKEWLLAPAKKEEIIERQTAIQSMKDDTPWRQEITAYGYHNDKKESSVNVHTIVNLLDQQLNIVDGSIWKIARILMPLASLTVLFGIISLSWAMQWIYLPLLINAVLLGILFKPLLVLTKEFDQISHFLKGNEKLIQEMESKQFDTPLLIGLQAKLKDGNSIASQAIRSLRHTLHFLLNRANMLYMPLNFLFLLDLQSLRMALSWKKKHLMRMEGWFSSIHTIEAISDLSSYAFANPDSIYPEVSETPHCLSTQQMGHPLIHPTARVANDFELSGEGKLGLITGSNMSGKSTFLRTIGVNLVLAQMGAPVCATSFRFSIVRIFTSMRTQDNLKENVSSFYAELRRIKQLLDTIEGDLPIFYMLDEILKGTNSEDRHKGAISLINKLTHQNCRGLISTHDIQLSTLAKEASNIENFSFNSRIEGDEIIFDYKISNSPCDSFNASKLMEKMGIL